MRNNPTLSVTADGSHTLYAPQVDECYHSSNGAIQESVHIFLKAALHARSLQNVSILEIGFGTGLNAYLTLQEAMRNGLHVHYTSLELYPISTEVAATLNYATQQGEADNSPFMQLHTTPWDSEICISSNFTLHKRHIDFTQATFPTEKYDVVYFDAFSPEKQPEMWSEEVFEKIFRSMAHGGILTTYCAKGVVRRILQKVGFKVERLPGPPGKREILRATKE